MDIHARLGQRALELAVLQFKLPQPFGLAGVHAAVLSAPLVKGGITAAVFAADFLDRHASLGLTQETNDLLLAVIACTHVHRSPG